MKLGRRALKRDSAGVGMASVAISFIMCTYYNLVITWALYYLFSSFQAPLPWQTCNNTWNTPNCTDHATNSSYSSTASQEFFKCVYPCGETRTGSQYQKKEHGYKHALYSGLNSNLI
ncbi:hypothetical protein fugu_008854 [Takifugu bimaculatus]|uniref:Uncharacterized protein n=1 Tax=Takifugu bimaculatus TaxID=433685 RepID=A0A4Z2AYY9_9TELE|nr:hypothetical protein fugu_008854 [Takifugu bimaculatus]